MFCYSKVRCKLCASVFILFSSFVFSASVQAACSATIDSFPPSFNGDLTITNETGAAVSSWQVVMTFSDGSVVTGGNVTVDNPGPPSTTISNVVFNGSIPVGGSIIAFFAGSGAGDLVSITGDLCGPVVASEGLTIEKNITSDNGGTATLDDFDVSFNDGTGTTEVPWADPTSVTGGTEVVSTVAGTYTLSELDFPNYTEGVWSCTDDANNSVVPVTNGGLFSGADVVVASGQAVTCSITNDDIAPVIPLPTDVPATVCSVDVNSFDQAVQWTGNGDPFAGVVTGSGATFLSSASPFVPGPGISVNTSNTTAVITGATETNFSDAYMAGDFIDYTIQTIGTSAISRLVENGGRDGTAPYQIDVLVSDDGFATAVSILSNYNVGNTAPFFDFISSADDGLAQLILDAGTQYQFRAVFYGANPSTSNILMDDFAITLDDCPVVSSLTIEKTITSDNGGTATLDDFDISIDDGTGANEIAWTTPTSLTGGSQEVATAAGTYTLSELDFADYTEGVWACTDDSNSSVVAVTNSGLFSGADIEVADGQAITCSITNDDDPITRIRFAKEPIPDQTWNKNFNYFVSPSNASYLGDSSSGAPFGFVQVEASNRANDSVRPGEMSDFLEVVAGTTITVAEDGGVTNNDLANTTQVYYECTDSNSLSIADGAATLIDSTTGNNLTAATFDLAIPTATTENVDITCTVLNVRRLFLNVDDVQVVEGNPGDARALEFTVSLNTSDSNNGALIPLTVNVLPVDTTVTYSITDLAVGGADPTDAADYTAPALLEVVIPAGSISTTLTIPIDEDLDVENDETLRVRLLTTTNGQSRNADRDGVGTIINDDAPGSLTIVKEVINDNGGTATVANFALTTDAGPLSFNPPTGSGTVADPLVYTSTPITSITAGTYSLVEADFAGYTEGTWSCTGAAGTVVDTFSAGSVVIGSDEDVICTITNNDDPAQLTLLKVVNNTAGGGTAVIGDWTLEANLAGGAAEVSGTTGVTSSVDAGDYVLSELSGPSGYTQTNLSCDAGTLISDTLTVGLDEDITCTFTNRDLITDLQITKTVSEFNPEIDDLVTFTLTVTNNGPDDATNVVVNDTVLSGFMFSVGSMLGGDSQNQTAPNLEWIINSLPAGAANTVSLNYQATVVAP